MTPQTKDINDYFEVEFEKIKPDVALSFDLHIYLSRNQHVIIWQKRGDSPTRELIEKYRAKGLKTLWVHRTHRDSYLLYMNAPVFDGIKPISIADVPMTPPSGSTSTAQPSAQAATPPPAPRAARVPAAPALSVEEVEKSLGLGPAPSKVTSADELVKVLQGSENPAKKSAAVAVLARDLLRESTQAADPVSQAKVDQKLRTTVRDILERVAQRNQGIANELWELSETDANLDHGVNVGTYATLLAMAFGRIDPELLGDIALAGLLHDIGVSCLSVAELPLKLNDAAQITALGYSRHVDQSLALIRGAGIGTQADRIAAMVRQHHEKFDGSGFPAKLQGFKIDDLSQLLGMADLLEEFSNGDWDGVKRSRREALIEIERIEKTRTFPQFFNPELMAAVLSWLKSDEAAALSEEAGNIAQGKLKGLLKTG